MKPAKHRLKGRQHSDDESVKIDYSKDSCEILKEILEALNLPNLSNSKKLSYYNVFVKFLYREGFLFSSSLSREETLMCLQSGLFSKWKELKAGALRAIRYFCTDTEAVHAIFKLHLHYLIVRSLDICLNNDVERMNALRLIRRIMTILLPLPLSPSSSSFSSTSPSVTSLLLTPIKATKSAAFVSALPSSTLQEESTDFSTCSSMPTAISQQHSTSQQHLTSMLVTKTAPLQQVLTDTSQLRNQQHRNDFSATKFGATNLPLFPSTPPSITKSSSSSTHLVSLLSCPAMLTSFKSLLHGVVAIANEGFFLKDKLFNVCLSTICELAILEPSLASEIGGITCLLRNVHQFYGHPRINEALVSTVLNIFNFPHTRHLIKINLELEQMLVPFTDLEYKASLEAKDRFDSSSDIKYGACKLALGTILRSWSGIFYICNQSSGGLRSLFSMLSISNMETRKEILDVFYDVFRISVPEWTDDFNVALASVADLSKTMDSWKLVNGFIEEEAKFILPHTTSTRLNLIDNHMSFVLCCFVDIGILEAVTKAVISSDKHVCVRATILLGELLHLTSLLLPSKYNQQNHCLPSLVRCIMQSTDVNPSLRMQCSDALNCLLSIQNSKRNSPTDVSSCFLRHQIFLCQLACQLHHHSSQSKSVAFDTCSHSAGRTSQKESSVERESSDCLPQLMKESQVLYTVDSKSWKWSSVSTILKFPENSLDLAEEVLARRFLQRLVELFKPSGKNYSVMKLSNENYKEMTQTAFQLIDYLLNPSKEQVAKGLLFQFLQDINIHLIKVLERSSITESSLNPSSLINTCSQNYFLFIGKLSSHKKGNELINSSKIYDSLSRLSSSNTSSDIIIKLMISCLDYSNSKEARNIFKEALSSTSEKSCQYCTSFMRIFLRCQLPLFTDWCLPLLINQLKNQSIAVATEALSVMLEASEQEINLRFLANHRHELRDFGFKSERLIGRFFSLPDIFLQLLEEGVVEKEMRKWREFNNQQYVNLIEERLMESMTTYEKTHDCNYARRTSRKYVRKDVLIPVHLYGQLVQHEKGAEYLIGQTYMEEYFETVRTANTSTKDNIKTALWIMGHIGSTELGFKILMEQDVVQHIIKVAEINTILTLRGTAYYVLGMLASTTLGCEELKKFGWVSVKAQKVDFLNFKSNILRETDVHGLPMPTEDKRLCPTVDQLPEIVEGNNEKNDNKFETSIRMSTSTDRVDSRERRPGVITTILQKIKPRSHKTSTESLNYGPERSEESSCGSPDGRDDERGSSSVKDKSFLKITGDRNRKANDGGTSDKVEVSAQSSGSSTGKISVSMGSDYSSVFISNQGMDDRVASTETSVERNVPGSLSNPDIFRSKINRSTAVDQCWSTVGDVSERRGKTLSLDYRNSIARHSNFRYSIRDQIRNIRGAIKSFSESETRTTHKRNASNAFGNFSASNFPDPLKLQQSASHFISISLPENMEQVFKYIKSETSDKSTPRNNISHSLRREFFRQSAASHDKLTNRQMFGKLFDGLEEHKTSICFFCLHHKTDMSCSSVDEETQPKKMEGSNKEAQPTSPLTEESEIGRMLIRKEVLRLLLQLSCNVGAKSTEQGLLILKQRFSKSFQNLCLYSEVSHLLATCSFALDSRRFVQELFLDLDFRECNGAAQKILNLPKETTPPTSHTDANSSSASVPEDKAVFLDFDFNVAEQILKI